MTNTVLYIMAEHFDIKNPQRLLQREVKGFTVINPVVNWAVILNSQGFYTTCLLKRTHTHTHKPVFIKDGIRNELLKKNNMHSKTAIQKLYQEDDLYKMVI